ncbi:hypothetical protein [Burkholderia contaminans]
MTDSIHGPFVINRHSAFQAEALINAAAACMRSSRSARCSMRSVD